MADQPQQRRPILQLEFPEGTTVGELGRAKEHTNKILTHVHDIAELILELSDNEYSLVHGALKACGSVPDCCSYHNCARDIAISIAGRMLVDGLELDLSNPTPPPGQSN